MPLRDHFHSPIDKVLTWPEFHGGWPMEIVRNLFDILPPRYHASPKLNLNSPFEVDVSTHRHERQDFEETQGFGDGGIATLSPPTLTIEADLNDQDVFEIRIYDDDLGRELVAAIEIVSPGNKDRPENRAKFVRKVSALLQKGVCVSIIDPVSTRKANMYLELLESLGRTDPNVGSSPQFLYAVTLRKREKPKRRPLLDAWYYPMIVGQPLPTIPIWLSPDLRIELPLEVSYQETCRILKIPALFPTTPTTPSAGDPGGR